MSAAECGCRCTFDTAHLKSSSQISWMTYSVDCKRLPHFAPELANTSELYPGYSFTTCKDMYLQLIQRKALEHVECGDEHKSARNTMSSFYVPGPRNQGALRLPALVQWHLSMRGCLLHYHPPPPLYSFVALQNSLSCDFHHSQRSCEAVARFSSTAEEELGLFRMSALWLHTIRAGPSELCHRKEDSMSLAAKRWETATWNWWPGIVPSSPLL
jgi:hypothetical protein